MRLIFGTELIIRSEAETSDRELLIRAASAVVLQRELSLTRRIYTWLLGSAEESDKQVAYFTQYGLDLLVTTLHVSRYTRGPNFSDCSLPGRYANCNFLQRSHRSSTAIQDLPLPTR